MSDKCKIQESLIAIADHLRFASIVMPNERWEAVCLDTLVHVTDATLGLFADVDGSPIRSIGESDSTCARIASASRDLSADEEFVRLDVDDRSYDLLRVPDVWRLNGAAAAVLAWEHPVRCAVDPVNLSETVRAIFR